MSIPIIGPRQTSHFPSCDQLISIIQPKIRTIIHTMAPVNSNRLGTGKQIPCNVVGIVPTVTLLGGLLAPCIGARDLGLYQNNGHNMSA